MDGFTQLSQPEANAGAMAVLTRNLPKGGEYHAARALYHHAQLSGMLCQLRDNFLAKLVSCAAVGTG